MSDLKSDTKRPSQTGKPENLVSDLKSDTKRPSHIVRSGLP